MMSTTTQNPEYYVYVAIIPNDDDIPKPYVFVDADEAIGFAKEQAVAMTLEAHFEEDDIESHATDGDDNLMLSLELPYLTTYVEVVKTRLNI